MSFWNKAMEKQSRLSGITFVLQRSQSSKSVIVIPAEAGIQLFQSALDTATTQDAAQRRQVFYESIK
jgi:hypothetical protein